MITRTHVVPYTGVWHLYSNEERNPLGYTADACVRIDALSRLRGNHVKIDFDPSAAQRINLSAAQECFAQMLDACQFEIFCRNPLNDVIVLDIAHSSSSVATLIRMALSDDETWNKIPGTMDLDRLVKSPALPVTEPPRPSPQRIALFSVFGLARYRLMCNMHGNKDAVDSPMSESAINIATPTPFAGIPSALRQFGDVVVPVKVSDLAAFPLRLLLRDWDIDVKRLAENGTFKEFGTWLDTVLSKEHRAIETDMPVSDVATFALLTKDLTPDNVLCLWPVAGYNELCIRIEFTTEWVFEQASFHAIITLQYGDSFLESLCSSDEVAQTTLPSTPSVHAIIGAALSVGTRLRTLYQHVRFATQNRQKSFECRMDCKAIHVGRRPKPERLGRAEQSFRGLLSLLTERLFFG